MIARKHWQAWLVLIGTLAALQAVYVFAQQNAQAQVSAAGQHDFDFCIGTWRTHISRRLHPLTGSDDWTAYDGTSIVRPLWDGRASLGETLADGPAGHLEALSLRLYNPQSHQWALSYASSGGTTSTASSLSTPTIGHFEHSRGDFYDTESYNGRNVLVRNTWSEVTQNSIRFEQAFSLDGGRTWETNWIAEDTRVAAHGAAALLPAASLQPASTQEGGAHDFDFEFGAWKTRIRRLQHPLTDAKNWTDYAGLSTVRKVWGGAANLGELEVDGTGSHIEGLSFRLYNAKSHQWSIYWANSNDGTLDTPMVGGFKNGRGEFYNLDDFQGRKVLVRFVFADIGPASFHFEQSLSVDGGKSWQPNWIAEFERER